MPRILLAEDDDSLRAFLSRALQRAGYDVTSCADGDEALAALDDHQWDLLLTDIVMPGVDGIEVARQAAARQADLRIMFITGFAAVALAAGDRAPTFLVGSVLLFLSATLPVIGAIALNRALFEGDERAMLAWGHRYLAAFPLWCSPPNGRPSRRTRSPHSFASVTYTLRPAT